MSRYETLLLTVPEITKDETSTLENQFEQSIKKARGSLISFDRWGKYRLAYPIRKNEYGVYFLARFEADDAVAEALIEDVKTLAGVKYANLVMRHMTTHLPMHQSLEYQRPESLEDVPTRDVDTFLRENKMEGLLTSVASHDVKKEMPEKISAVDMSDDEDDDMNGEGE